MLSRIEAGQASDNKDCLQNNDDQPTCSLDLNLHHYWYKRKDCVFRIWSLEVKDLYRTQLVVKLEKHEYADFENKGDQVDRRVDSHLLLCHNIYVLRCD